MADYTLLWNNTSVVGNSNATAQRASYRRRSTGGGFVTTGFSPANDLPLSAVTTAIIGLLFNVVYEFKIEAICTLGGPILNSGGVFQRIKFNCIQPTFVNTSSSSAISLSTTGTDVTKVKFTLKKKSDNSVISGPTTVDVTNNTATLTVQSLVGGTDYYWEYQLIASVSNADTTSTICSPYDITTDTASTTCPAITNLTIGGAYELNWNNTPVLNDVNVQNLRVVHRDRLTGGAFLTTGVTPANDLAKTVSSAVVSLSAKNRVQQFKVQTICTVGGPIDNTNGIVEAISFECPTFISQPTNTPPFQNTEIGSTTLSYGITITDTDLVKIRGIIKLQGSNTVIQTVNGVVQAPKLSFVINNLTPQTAYTLEVELGAVVNGVDVYSNVSVCGPFNFTTQAALTGRFDYTSSDVIPPTNLIESSEIFNITTGQNYTVDLTAITTPEWLYVVEPSTEPVKTTFYANSLSTGPIGQANNNPNFDVWYVAGLVAKTGGGFWRVYKTAEPTQFNTNTVEFRKAV